jgi:hypothetical protein
VLRQAKRNKAFETSGGIGLAVDGTTVGRCTSSGCPLCRPYRNADQEITGYRHHLVLSSVVGTELCLPFDVEPYGPVRCGTACFQEYARLMHRRSETFAEDAIIAATARVHGLTVATRNERHFRPLGVAVFDPFKA